ncbi:MAG: ATP-binding cassette domain-containing protein, partial [Chloroflexota bacterium]
LENYLANYRGSVILVSHDRVFLNHTVNRIIEIDEHTRNSVLFTGNYDAYTTEKARRVETWRTDYASQQDELKTLRRLLKSKTGTTTQKRNIRTKDGDRFIKHFKDQTADKTLSREASNLEERLRRIEADPIPQPPRPITLSADYDPATLRGHFPVTLSNLSLRYGERVILDNVSLSITAGERLAITGENGAGKSTLIKLIAGEISPDSGTVTIAPSVQSGYLPQVDELPEGDTLIAAYGNGLPGSYEDHKAALISSGFFTYEQLATPSSGASSGQRRKVQLARLIAQQANVLLLDEPTNHLSLDVVESIETALDNFIGTVIVVSHDRRFLERFGGKRLHLANGSLHEVAPDYASSSRPR